MKNRVLVIDDDISVRESLRTLLQEAGYTVTLAADGEEGIAVLECEEFELLILDLDLPKVSGWDVLDHAAGRHPDLSIIILTGHAHQCDSEAFAGADALLGKPPDVSQLMDTAAKLLKAPLKGRARKARWGYSAFGSARLARSSIFRLM